MSLGNFAERSILWRSASIYCGMLMLWNLRIMDGSVTH